MVVRNCLSVALFVGVSVACTTNKGLTDSGSGGAPNGGESGGRAAGGFAGGGSSFGSGGAASGGMGAMGGALSPSGGSGTGGGSGGSSTGAENGSGGLDSGLGGSSQAARYDCDARKIVCLPIVPVEPCESMFVHSVQDGCYGPCVPIQECHCGERADCPDPDGTEPYTCISSAGHCSPWLQ